MPRSLHPAKCEFEMRRVRWGVDTELQPPEALCVLLLLLLLCRYQIMRSCWDADPFNRPPFRKVVEQIEQQLSDTTKHVGLIAVMTLTLPTRGSETTRKRVSAANLWD